MPEPPHTPRRPAPDSTSGEAIRASLERTLADAATGAPALQPPPVPDHTLLRRIGSGAYGEVWLARNALGTLRAVKVIYRARFKEDRPYEREFNGILKYEPLSRTHEGLVQVLHAGRGEGCFYYVMELADGEPIQNEKCKIKNDPAPAPETATAGSSISNFEFSILNYHPRTLHSELAHRERLPPVETAQLVLRLAGALAHLHAHGLVHRDIKPSNVIFVGGQPKLADIGLVTDVGSSHSFVGTEGFIPPEGPGTPQADIYGLGKLLYELATGRDRMDFPQLPPLSDLKGARTGSPQPPGESGQVADGKSATRSAGLQPAAASPVRTPLDLPPACLPPNAAADCESATRSAGLQPAAAHPVRTPLDLPAACLPPNAAADCKSALHADAEALLELNEVMTRACAPDTKQRYSSATELQADLNLFLAGRSLRQARNIEVRLLRLKRFAFAACALVALAFGVGWYAKLEEHRAKQQAQVEASLRRRAEAAEQEAQRQLYTALLEQARTTVRSGEVGQRVRTLDAVRRAAAISNTLELRREAWRALATPDLRFEKEFPTGPRITYAQLDPDFTRIALGRDDGPVEIRSVADGQLLASLPYGATNAPCCAQWSADGRHLAVQWYHRDARGAADLEVWDATSWRRTISRPGVRSGGMVFHPARPELMVSEGEGAVTILNVDTGTTVARHGLPSPPGGLAYSPDGRYFAATFASERRYRLSIRDATTNVRKINIELPAPPVTFDWHPSGRWIAVPVTDGRLLIADTQTGKHFAMGRHKGAAIRALFSPDGDYLFSLDTDGDWVCWSFAGVMVQFTVGGQSSHFQFRKDGRQCAVGTVNSVKLHAFEHPACERELICAIGECVRPAAFSADGRWAAVPGEGTIGIWDLTTNVPPLLMAAVPNAACFFSEDSSALFIWSQTNLLRWPVNLEADPPQPSETLLNTRGTAFQSATLQSNRLVLTTRESIELFEITNATLGARRSITTAKGQGTLSPDGRWFGMRYEMSPLIEVFQLPELVSVVRYTNDATVWGAAFTPGGGELVLLTRVGVVFLDTVTWQRTRELPIELGVHSAIRFAPDGRTFWLNRDLRNATLYDAQSLKEQMVLPMGLMPLALDSDGRRLLIAVDGRRLQVWDLAALRERFRQLGLDWAGRL